jgi:hypothetical protein
VIIKVRYNQGFGKEILGVCPLQITLRVCKIVHAKFEILSCGSIPGQLNVLLSKDVIWNNVCQI